MAEVVEYRVDRTLGELKVLINFGIFDEEHAKEIIKKREIFEYNLRRRTRTKLDYLKYIRFEMNMLESIEKYKNSILKKTEAMEDEIDRKIFQLQAKKLNDIVRVRASHISVLYRKLAVKYQFDSRIWIAYIDFAKQRKWHTRVSALYWRALRVAGNDESLWLEAAKHELENRQDQNTAKKLFLMGLRHHPESLGILSRLEEICDSEAVKNIKAKIERERAEANGEMIASTSAAAAAATTTTTATTNGNGVSTQNGSQSRPNQTKMETLYECFETKGIDETRRLYADLEKSVKNQKLSLYVGMIQVELWQLAKDKSNQQLERVRSIYERAISKYGKQKAKLWYEYLQFEHQHSKSLEDFERVNQIYQRAQATLIPSKVDRVVEKYTMMQVSTTNRTDIEYSDYSDLEES